MLRRVMLDMRRTDSISYRTMSTKQIKDTVLDAAAGLLVTEGDGFTMHQLEARAHISRASIYRHVGSKEEILALLRDERGVAVDQVDVQSKILEAARQVFARQGLRGATMEQIAAEADVGVATVYRHFGDKETLLLAFINNVTPRGSVHTIMQNPTDDVAADLRSMVHSILEFSHENRDIMRLVMVGDEQDLAYLSQIRANTDSSQARLTSYFEHQIEAGQIQPLASAEALGLALMGMVINFSVLGPLHNGIEIENVDDTSELIVNIFLNSLRAT
ncbi:MAG: TetR/AcrR family transcriptional regulator [Chloroflexi bacterium]|nr:MAG: TetR/AcrR family transcriptional regulator [Chloroflexota bacterium]MBL1195811.1 TetR/AcrR family transcriptional regulator [Chloroflexota bacterium]